MSFCASRVRKPIARATPDGEFSRDWISERDSLEVTSEKQVFVQPWVSTSGEPRIDW